MKYTWKRPRLVHLYLNTVSWCVEVSSTVQYCHLDVDILSDEKNVNNTQVESSKLRQPTADTCILRHQNIHPIPCPFIYHVNCFHF